LHAVSCSTTGSNLLNKIIFCREIEVKVMSYQDDLENGEKGIKAGWTIQDQVRV
jgi:cwf21 domain